MGPDRTKSDGKDTKVRINPALKRLAIANKINLAGAAEDGILHRLQHQLTHQKLRGKKEDKQYLVKILLGD